MMKTVVTGCSLMVALEQRGWGFVTKHIVVSFNPLSIMTGVSNSQDIFLLTKTSASSMFYTHNYVFLSWKKSL